MQTVRAADTNEVVKLIFRESDNDRKVSAEGAQAPWGGAPALTRPPPTVAPLWGGAPPWKGGPPALTPLCTQ